MMIVGPDELEGTRLEALLAHRGAIVVFARGNVGGEAAACALFADWLILEEGTSLVFDAPQAWAGAVSRIGRRALRIMEKRARSIAAADAFAAGLCDAIAPMGTDPGEFIRTWLGGRSELALDTGAVLVRSRGGDALERAEFARIFAAGEPQEGLAAFLEKRRPRFGSR